MGLVNPECPVRALHLGHLHIYRQGVWSYGQYSRGLAMTTDSFLLYTAKVCPFAARTELALELSGVKYDTYEIDLANKPSWYAEKINKASKGTCLTAAAALPGTERLTFAGAFVQCRVWW